MGGGGGGGEGGGMNFQDMFSQLMEQYGNGAPSPTAQGGGDVMAGGDLPTPAAFSMPRQQSGLQQEAGLSQPKFGGRRGGGGNRTYRSTMPAPGGGASDRGNGSGYGTYDPAVYEAEQQAKRDAEAAAAAAAAAKNKQPGKMTYYKDMNPEQRVDMGRKMQQRRDDEQNNVSPAWRAKQDKYMSQRGLGTINNGGYSR